MSDLKRKAEAVLFAAGKAVELSEIARHCYEQDLQKIIDALKELQKEYEEKHTSLSVINDGDFWKIAVREQFLPIARKLVTKTELKKSLVETLATIAAKAPVLQSTIIKIRTNKAYDHLSELEGFGYILREKKGRTKLIKLTSKFFDYFDIPESKLKEKFSNVAKLEQQIIAKEQQIEDTKDEIQKRKVDQKEAEDQHKKEAEKESKQLDAEIVEYEKRVKDELKELQHWKVEDGVKETPMKKEGNVLVYKEKEMQKTEQKIQKQHSGENEKEFVLQKKEEKIEWEKPEQKKEDKKEKKQKKISKHETIVEALIPKPAQPEEPEEEQTQEQEEGEIEEKQEIEETTEPEKEPEEQEEKQETEEPQKEQETQAPEPEKELSPFQKLREESKKIAETLPSKECKEGIFAEGVPEDVKKKVEDSVEEMTGLQRAKRKMQEEAEDEKYEVSNE